MAHEYVRDARGRFAPVPGGSSGRKRSGGGSGGSNRRSGGSRGRSPGEKLALAGSDVAAARLKHSDNPHARAAGFALSVAGSVYRNKQVQAALKNRTR